MCSNAAVERAFLLGNDYWSSEKTICKDASYSFKDKFNMWDASWSDASALLEENLELFRKIHTTQKYDSSKIL